MQFLLTLSDFIIPVTVLFIVVFGCLKRVADFWTILAALLLILLRL